MLNNVRSLPAAAFFLLLVWLGHAVAVGRFHLRAHRRPPRPPVWHHPGDPLPAPDIPLRSDPIPDPPEAGQRRG